MSGGFKVVIPARYGSTRLPGKPLADLDGVPMVVRVAARAAESGAEEVVVATDDERVVRAALEAGFEALMTRSDHASGSDRVMEVAEQAGWPGDTVVVNVQGDEPLIPPVAIRQVAKLLLDDPDLGTATLCEPIDDPAAIVDPNVVKVVTNAEGFALYFSRAPIPYARDAWRTAAVGVELPAGENAWSRHIGIYGFRVAALRRFVALPVGALERLEALEQLRMLDHGMSVRVAEATVAVPGGVDTEADLERLRVRLTSGL